jgi:hypothetical protein
LTYGVKGLVSLKEKICSEKSFSRLTNMTCFVYVNVIGLLLRTDYFRFRFYYPRGKPTNEHFGDAVLQKISSVFQQFPNQQVPCEKFDAVTKARNFVSIYFLQNHILLTAKLCIYLFLYRLVSAPCTGRFHYLLQLEERNLVMWKQILSLISGRSKYSYNMCRK